MTVPEMNHRTDRVGRAIAEAAELLDRRDDNSGRMTTADVVAYYAKRCGLPPELAAKITATRPAEIMRQAQDLAATRASIAAAEAEAQAETPAVRRAPVAGSYSPLHDDGDGFDPEDTAQRIRKRY
ncbi:hypothetical protein [Micromonospora sp. IBHARD004]|uniref:hypothetical protein n=1 Tax=Micromonospora sp. IBHARD004 TaxID=3457764 RepID=UPI0040596D85